MDETEKFDPNKTVAGGPVDNRTRAMDAPPTASDPNRTTAWEQPETLTVTVTPSREATMANGPAREQFLIELTANDGGALPGVGTSGVRTPLNLCLVIDRSGSMEGAPLDYAKQACQYVVDLLSPTDQLSIVVFDEIVDVLMPPQLVTDKEAIKDGIAQLQPGYTTNISDAMTMAAQQLAPGLEDKSRATRMVFLTDGEPTAGIREFQPLLQHAFDIKQRGITCTFLGFGPEYNEELLASMARKTGGNYYYISQPQLIPEIFRTELEKLMTVAAVNPRLEMKLSRWVTLRSVTGQSVAPSGKEFTLDLADLERGATMSQVLDFEFENHPLGHYRVAGGRLTFEDVTGGASKVIDVDLVMEFTADKTRYSMPVNPLVEQAFQVSAASRVVEKTIMGLKTHQLTAEGALAELEKTQMLLVQDGRTEEAREVTLAMQAIKSGDIGGAEKTLMGAMLHLDQGKK